VVLSLRAEGLRFAYPGGPLLLRDVGFALEAGQPLCLLGPNGTGKTTLLRCILGLERVGAGRIEVQGRNLGELRPAAAARLMAYVPQDTATVFPFAVFDVVLMGRSPHLRFMASPTPEDRRIVHDAMARLDIAYLAERRFHELSGGERQMVLVARALAQGARILVLDEPCAGLDIGNQVRLIRIVRALAREGYSVLLTTHLPDHAFAIGGQVALLKDGQLRGPAPPEVLLASAELTELYGTAIEVIRAPSGQVLCVPKMGDEHAG
jgi:iron complex transport system ATP-binding protein